MKRDVNFIRHIKPQLKEREKKDRVTSKWIREDNAIRELGLNHPIDSGLDVISLSALIHNLFGNPDSKEKPDQKSNYSTGTDFQEQYIR